MLEAPLALLAPAELRLEPPPENALLLLEPEPPLDCMVSDISQTGARILIDASVNLPPEFTLLLSQNVKRQCKIVWRSEKQVGVRFLAA